VFEAGDGADDREWPIQIKRPMSDVPNLGKKNSKVRFRKQCGRFGLIFGRFGLWPFWHVALLVVAVLVYGRFEPTLLTVTMHSNVAP